MVNQQLQAPFGSILENMFFQAPSDMKDYCVDLCLCQAMMMTTMVTMIGIIIVEYCMFSNYLSIYWNIQISFQLSTHISYIYIVYTNILRYVLARNFKGSSLHGTLQLEAILKGIAPIHSFSDGIGDWNLQS